MICIVIIAGTNEFFPSGMSFKNSHSLTVGHKGHFISHSFKPSILISKHLEHTTCWQWIFSTGWSKSLKHSKQMHKFKLGFIFSSNSDGGGSSVEINDGGYIFNNAFENSLIHAETIDGFPVAFFFFGLPTGLTLSPFVFRRQVIHFDVWMGHSMNLFGTVLSRLSTLFKSDLHLWQRLFGWISSESFDTSI